MKDAAERSRVAASFLDFYEADTLLHFHEEEEALFPMLMEHAEEAPPELIQVLVEHVRIHGLVTRLRASLTGGAPDAAILEDLGEMLRAHIRLEENELFPLIERTVPDDGLREITLAPRQRG